MTHAAGVCSVEWAIPLDSGDDNDIRVKPGDTLRFNLTYFDAFRSDLNGTQMGVAWGHNLDEAQDWGLLQLVSDVKHDGGQSFQVPGWLETVFRDLPNSSEDRLRLTGSSLASGGPKPVAKALVEYSYLDVQGQEVLGKAKLYLPAETKERTTSLPLYFSAGYELDDGTAVVHARRGFAVITPRELKANPLVQSINPDVALLHIARALPFIDDARVVIGGGSAGGYLTLMLAAETFPLAGAAADVPPVNWGYNAAFFLQSNRWKGTTDPQTVKETLPVFAVASIAENAKTVFGNDPNDPIWFRNSPLSQLDTITCPVITYWSTADMLVPIDQIGSHWVRPLSTGGFSSEIHDGPQRIVFDATRSNARFEPAFGTGLRVVQVVRGADQTASSWE